MGAQNAEMAALRAARDQQQERGPRAVYAQRFRHSGQALRHKLATNQNCVWAHLGDSTANGSDEWLYLSLDQFRLDYPNMRVTHELWNDTTQAIDAATTLQAGVSGSEPAPVIKDTFTRNSPSLNGTAADTGQVWAGGSGVGPVDGDEYVTNGTVTPYLPHAIDAQGPDGIIGRLTAIIPVGSDNNAAFRLSILGEVGGNNELMLGLGATPTGITGTVYRRDVGVAVGIGGTVSDTTYSNAAERTVAMTLSLKNGQVTGTFTVNGGAVKTISGPLGAAAGWGGFAAAAKNLRVHGGLANVRVTDVSLGLTGSDPATLRVINGSMPGANLTYFQDPVRIAKMLPVDADLLTLASSHNHGTQTAATFVLQVKDTLDRFALPRVPSAGVVLVSQNPQFAPIAQANQDAHLARLRAIRPLAAERGYGYIAGMEKFLGRADRGLALVNTDGVHPLAAGSTLWRDAALTFLRTGA